MASIASSRKSSGLSKDSVGGNPDLDVPPSLTRQLTSHMDEFADGVKIARELDSDLEPTEVPREQDSSNNDDEKLMPSTGKLGPKYPEMQLSFATGKATDIGGGATNQDDMEVMEIDGQLVMIVLDGHGRELGQLASEVARASMIKSFRSQGMFDLLRDSPNVAMEQIFSDAHQAIKQAFRNHYEDMGMKVQDTPEGYLIKRSKNSDVWSCTHGGTTATVVVVLDGWRMIVGNVGDSTALWGGMDQLSGEPVVKELSAEHSPESYEEFNRIRQFRSVASDPHIPEMRFVYDAPSFSKHQCPAIFEQASSDPDDWVKTERGNYYKNVRNEWATLVTTPPYARFQDALAFTRSLGDLHLHVYGVSSTPQVSEFDLTELEMDSSSSVLLVCTDGVWDNWKYEDIVQTSLSKEMLAQVDAGEHGAQRATDLLMTENIRLAKAHFGNQADNMTAILCFISTQK